MSKDTNKVKGIYLYFDIYQSTKLMSNEQKAMFLDAILTKFNGGDFEITDPVVQMAFSFVERSFNYEQEKNLQRSEKARESVSKRWEYERIKRNTNDTNVQNVIRTDTNDTINIKQETRNINNNIKNTSYSLSASDADSTQNSLLENMENASGVSQVPDCPHGEIVRLYHETLAMMPKVKSWDNERQRFLRARWRERFGAKKYSTMEEGIAYWKRLFEHIRDHCPWLTGEIEGRGGRPFLCDLEWIVRPTNFRKIIEGRYDRKAA